MTSIVTLSHIKKSYFLSNGDEIPVLQWVDLDIREWEFIALMGHSGSWKSTLLNIIWLLHPLWSGSYLLRWEDISKYWDDYSSSYIRNKKIGFIFQSYFLIPRLSALENVILPLKYSAISAEQRKKKGIQYLKDVGLEDKMYNRPSELSGGQQQRVAIARALINEPDIILADEPTGALDMQTSKDIMELISSLHKLGKTIIMVTHESEVAKYAQRIIYLKDGVVADSNYILS